MSEFINLYTEIFQKNGLDRYIRDNIMVQFEKLTEIMISTNQVMNITALTSLDKIIPLHYADCVLIERFIPQNATVLDVGCGGGFPILPLAIVRPDLKITGLDSTDKKIRYVQNTADELGLSINTISGRAEDIAKLQNYRDHFDIVVSRAVARLNVLDELCLPFVRIGGSFVAMKGSAGREEVAEAEIGIHKLCGSVHDLYEYELHTGGDIEKRFAVQIQKVSNTPKEFPRSFGAMKKKPL